MAEHTEPPINATPVKERDEPLDLQGFLEELGNSREFQVNGVGARQGAEAVFCTLARRLSDGEDLKLFRFLGGNDGIGAILGACAIHRGPSHAKRMDRAEFITDVADHLRIPGDQALRVLTAVFTAIRDRIPEDEVAAVASQLPADLADLFRRPV
ncbi:DUF2267 domain-containing protein [Comamonas sp. JC664]|uniref:DUF2267 domain-containing protein n=1 Tax=Comamonas sp. JC664 TaxID=2801917 RepID=UPI00174AD2BE|nr:DUF2267 domain-containing protein [Comamonas sp. JC664]MBL0694388.1 DUF2267 domain-containing protein [Comamonas sp. JC664]GHG77348.1 hypothetical protein GCM10012319_27220 [Comamonas sp. KCTC 72670]